MTDEGRGGDMIRADVNGPPRLAVWLIRVLAGDGMGRVLAGDLGEEFRRFVEPARGRSSARRWYWGQVVRSAWPVLRERAAGRGDARSGAGATGSGPITSGTRGATGGREPRFGGVGQDVVFAGRVLSRRPLVSATAILTLALAIGFSTVAYSVLEAVVLRALPYEDPGTLVWIHPDAPLTPAQIHELSERSRSMEGVSAFERRRFTLLDGGMEPDIVRGVGVSPGHFRLLGTAPALGRGFLPDEGRPGEGNVLVLSHALWSSRYGSDPTIVGQTVDLGLPVPYTVVGVMGPDHRGIEEDWMAWVPLTSDPAGEGWNEWRSQFALARLAPSATPVQATLEVRSIFSDLIAEVPQMAMTEDEVPDISVVSLQEVIVGPVQQAILALGVGVALLLLMACANVGNLLLAMGSARSRELAVRRALGADRGRLIRQLFTESLVLALVGGALGVLLAGVGLPVVVGLLPAEVPRTAEIGLSTTVLAVGLLLAVASGVITGVLPAILQSRTDPGAALQGAARQAGPGRASRRTHSLLIVAESALAVLVAVGAGLVVRSFSEALAEDPGFRAEQVIALRPNLSRARYPTDADREQFFVDAQERLQALPGVEEVGGILFLPMTSGGWYSRWFRTGQDPEDLDSWSGMSHRPVLPGYFESMGIEVLRGRSLTTVDMSTGGREVDAPDRVVVMNQAAAQVLFGDEDPVGRQIQDDPEAPGRTVVGVVADVRQRALDQPTIPELYVPISDEPVSGGFYLTLKVAGDPSAILASARSAILEMDPRVPVSHAEALSDVVSRSVTTRRVAALGAGAFGLFALLLGAVGIYGVTAYQVSSSLREVGVRVALGAGSTQILRGVVVRGLGPVLLGVGLGLAGAWAGGAALEGLLYGVPGRDLPTLIMIGFVLIGVAVMALTGPALRASRVDPVLILSGD